MFLNDMDDIINWLKLNTNLYNKFEIVNINGQLIVNTFNDTEVFYNDNNKILVKFGNINGHFRVFKTRNLSNDKDGFDFHGFPEIINGDLIATNIPYTNGNGWNTKEIKGNINLCGQETSFENLNFLKNTKFETLFLKVYNTPFYKDRIDDKYYDFINEKIINREITINFENMQKIINLFEIDNNYLDNYINSFEDETLKNIDLKK